MLIKSVLSEKLCVKPRKGMIVVVTGCCWGHRITIGAVGRIVTINESSSNEVKYAIDVSSNVWPVSQWIMPKHLRQADSSERRIYRKQLKQR